MVKAATTATNATALPAAGCVAPLRRISSTAARRRGFTLIELIVVIVIVGILIAVAVPRLSGITPKYRLRGAARLVGSMIHEVRSIAGGTAKTYALHYDLDKNRFWMILPPEKNEDPNLPLDQRKHFAPRVLPEHVEFKKIILADGSEHTSGELNIVFDPLGQEGSHIVELRNSEDAVISIKFSAILGVVDYFNKEVSFEEYQ